MAEISKLCPKTIWPFPVKILIWHMIWCVPKKMLKRSDFFFFKIRVTKASMPSLLCRSQISIGSEFGQYIPTVVHTVRELQLWSKEIEWRHPSTKGSYCAPSLLFKATQYSTYRIRDQTKGGQNSAIVLHCRDAAKCFWALDCTALPWVVGFILRLWWSPVYSNNCLR